ncbi:protein NO VEIN domain-containing protein [Crossiella sp. CA198]|uniref:protein NO VEIN domain-containing protein n=1 Tax=Crossiella sp. CA198 TaxID=3455607 RepID=UPI003F8D435E
MGENKNMGGWMLSGNPKRFNVPALLADETHPSLREWSVVRGAKPDSRANRMRPGQRIFLWLSGDQAGLWGAGHITGLVKSGPPRTHQQYWANAAELAKAKAFVPVDLPIWETPILLDTVRAFPGLDKLTILEQPFGSNPFEVTPEQLAALEDLLSLPPGLPPTSSGAGFGSAELNRKVELAAMAAVTEYYAKRGARVADVSLHRRGWDLDCHLDNGEVLRVEVKGVRGDSPRFLLTRNEFIKATRPDWRLAVVTGALTTPKVAIHQGDRIRAHADPIQYQVTLP